MVDGPLDLLGEIHATTGIASGDWRNFREEVTGMYLLSGGISGQGEWYANHLIREFNRKVDVLSGQWVGASVTGLVIDPYDAGFRYEGTGDFRAYP
jgi:hypothetical protein